MWFGPGILRHSDGLVNTVYGPVVVRGPGPNGSWLYALYGWVPNDGGLLYWFEYDELWEDCGLTSEPNDIDVGNIALGELEF